MCDARGERVGTTGSHGPIAKLRRTLNSVSLLREKTDIAFQVQCFEATLPTTKCSPDDLTCLCTDTAFNLAAAGCNAANCTVVEVLTATNETYAACGVPVKDATATLIGVTVSFGMLAILMVVLRLVDRGISAQAQLGWDDLLIGLSGVSIEFWRLFVLVVQ